MALNCLLFSYLLFAQQGTSSLRCMKAINVSSKIEGAVSETIHTDRRTVGGAFKGEDEGGPAANADITKLGARTYIFTPVASFKTGKEEDP